MNYSSSTVTQSPRERLLREAIKITTSDRNREYGDPEDNFRNIAQFWNVHFEARMRGKFVHFTSSDVAIMMILMKCARLATNSTHRDSALDVAGYAACLADIQDANCSKLGTPEQSSANRQQLMKGLTQSDTTLNQPNAKSI